MAVPARGRQAVAVAGERGRRITRYAVPVPVLIVSAALAASLFGDSMLYAVMPSRPDDWGLSIGLVGVLLSANRLVRLVSNTVAAALFSRFGTRLPFAAAMLLAVVTTASYGWVTAFWLLLIARMTWGLCWSVLRLGAYWIVLDAASDANRGFLMGIYSAVARTGSIVGVVLGGVLTDSIGHEWTLTIFAAATGLGGIAWFLSSRSHAEPLIAARSPAVSTLAATSPGQRRRSATGGGLSVVLHDPRLLTVGLGGLSGMLVFSGLLTASIGFYFGERFGDDIAVAGLAIGIATFTGLVLGARFTIDLVLAPFAGHLSDRRGRMVVTLSAFGLGAIGLLILAAAPPLGIVLVAVAIAFIASTALVVLLDARAGDLAPPERRSAVMSTYATFLDLGAALGPLVGLSVGTLGALRWAFVAGGLILIVMAISYRLVMASDERASDMGDRAPTRPVSLD